MSCPTNRTEQTLDTEIPANGTTSTPETPRLLRATCAPELAPWLRQEVEDLGYEIEHKDHTGVEIRGLMRDAMRLTLRLRTAYHVLQRFADLKAKDSDAMYEGAIRLPWERVIPPDGYVEDGDVSDDSGGVDDEGASGGASRRRVPNAHSTTQLPRRIPEEREANRPQT